MAFFAFCLQVYTLSNLKKRFPGLRSDDVFQAAEKKPKTKKKTHRVPFHMVVVCLWNTRKKREIIFVESCSGPVSTI